MAFLQAASYSRPHPISLLGFSHFPHLPIPPSPPSRLRPPLPNNKQTQTNISPPLLRPPSPRPNPPIPHHLEIPSSCPCHRSATACPRSSGQATSVPPFLTTPPQQGPTLLTLHAPYTLLISRHRPPYTHLQTQLHQTSFFRPAANSPKTTFQQRPVHHALSILHP